MITGKRKGAERYMFIVAMMILALLVVVLMYTSFETWLTDTADFFLAETVGTDGG